MLEDMSRPAFFGEFPNPLIGVIRSLGTPEIQRFQRRFDSLPVHKRKSLRIFVADLKTEHKKFSGYGVKTDRVNYSLDVLVKVIDLKTNQIVFAKIVTGERSLMNTKFAQTVNDSLFQDLMKDALRQTAEAMNARFAVDKK